MQVMHQWLAVGCVTDQTSNLASHIILFKAEIKSWLWHAFQIIIRVMLMLTSCVSICVCEHIYVQSRVCVVGACTRDVCGCVCVFGCVLSMHVWFAIYFSGQKSRVAFGYNMKFPTEILSCTQCMLQALHHQWLRATQISGHKSRVGFRTLPTKLDFTSCVWHSG